MQGWRRDYQIVKRVAGLARAGTLIAVLSLVACSTPQHGPSPAAPVPGAGLGIYKVGKPYQVDGTWYYPREDWNYDETGIASWYGEAFHGRYTANGEVFDLNGLTAAHHTLQLPSVVQVTNLENGRSIELRVNDRGPFARGRIIDVSRHAAQMLGFERQGTAKVRVRILVPESTQVAAVAGRNGRDDDATRLAEQPQAAPRQAVDAQPLAPLQGGSPPASAATVSPPLRDASTVPTAALLKDPALPDKVTIGAAKPDTQIFIQAGAFAQVDNANRLKNRIGALGNVNISGVRINGADLWRVRLGPIASVDEADKLLARVVATGVPDAKIIVD